MRIDLPDGHHAELRDPTKVSERLRRPCLAAATDMASEKGAMEALQVADDNEALKLVSADTITKLGRLNDLVIVALVESWSYDVPIDVDTLLDLPGDAYTQLLADTAPLITDLLPNMSPDGAVDEAGERIPAHPFGPSNGSNPSTPVAVP